MLNIGLVCLSFYALHTAFNFNQFALYSPLQWLLLFGGFVSSITQALYFNKLAVDFDMVYKHTYIPAFFYMLFIGAFQQHISLSLPHLFIWLILLAIYQIVSIPNATYQRQHMYFAAVLFGCISFFIPYYSSSFILLVLLVITFKNINGWDLLSIISGLFLPLVLVLACNYLFAQNLPYYSIKPLYFKKLHFLPPSAWIIAVFALIASLGLARAFLNYFKNNIQTRKMLRFVLYFTFFQIAILLFNWNKFYEFIIVFCVPFALFVTYLLLGKSRRKLKNIIAYSMWLLALAHLFLQLNHTWHLV